MSTVEAKPKKKPPKKANPEQKPERIPINTHTFALLKKFATGEFREVLGDPDELYSYGPGRCPFCASPNGYERKELIRQGAMYTARRMHGTYQQNRNLWVECLDCHSRYKALEVWTIYVEEEK